MVIERPSEPFDEVAPDASAMIESMRAYGYTLPTAIADLIDNSIYAASRNIWLRFEFEGDRSWISVIDDGQGMTEQTLVSAMRLGSQSPLEERDARDLGRFGLGLKTASFSQARRLTVITRCRGGQSAVRRWDLDHLARPDVKGWQLLRSAHPDSQNRVRFLDEMELDQGTQILLEIIDRVVGGHFGTEKDREDHFLWQIERVREHLAMVFHRFICKPKGGIRIHVNGELVQPWDPFVEDHTATQRVGDYTWKLERHDTLIRITGFVLPHRDRFESAKAHHQAGGPGGWNAHQGFYLYRSDRLVIPGDWLGLGWQKEEHFKLARIRVDIPNSMDHEWQIDVKKSTASPPAALRRWLKGIAQEVRHTAADVYEHRGKYGPRKKNPERESWPWITVTKAGEEFSYRIDRRHRVLEPLITSLSQSQREELEALLRLIEETVPVQRIWIDTAENQDGAALPFANESSEGLRQLIVLCHRAQMRFRNITANAAWDILASFSGFQGGEAQAIIGQLRGDA